MSKAPREPPTATRASTAPSNASSGGRSRASSAAAASASSSEEGGGRARRGVRYNWVLGAVITDDVTPPSSSSGLHPPSSRPNGLLASRRSASPAPTPADASAAVGQGKGEAVEGKKKRRRSKQAQTNAGVTAAPAAAPSSSSSSPSISAASSSASSKLLVLPHMALPTERGTLVTIEPALHYLHLLARDPELSSVQLQRRYQREVLSWRDMPQPRSQRSMVTSHGRGAHKRQREPAAAAAASTSSSPSAPRPPALPPISLPTPPRPPPPSLPPSFTSASPFQHSGLHIHPSLQLPASPPPRPSFPHPLDPLLLPPPLPRRRKPVERCTSPSHFLLTPLALTPYGPDESIDLPLRSRMDDLLLSTLAGFFTPRLVMSEDTSKVWVDADVAGGGVGGKTRAYGSLERLLSPLRKRRVREVWSLREMALFELGVCLHGKDFHRVQKLVGSKTTSEVVGFYYTTWKHSAHYAAWKSSGRAAQQQPQPHSTAAAHTQHALTATIVISDDEDTIRITTPAPAAERSSSPSPQSAAPASPPHCPPSPSPPAIPTATSTSPSPASITECYAHSLQADEVTPAAVLAPAAPQWTAEANGEGEELDGQPSWTSEDKAVLSRLTAESNGIPLDDSRMVDG